MLRQRVSLLVFEILILFVSYGRSHMSYRCNVSYPSNPCLTLWSAFRDSLVNQQENLMRLDLVFNQPSRITPTIVKVHYNYSIADVDGCNVNSSGEVVLGWTSQSLYKHFHCTVINQLRFQLPFLILEALEDYIFAEEPVVDDYLWVGDDHISLPEVFLTLNVTFPSNLNECPSDDDIKNSLGELNHWLNAYAKAAYKGNVIQCADPADKGYTLPRSAVEPYTVSEFNLEHGENIFFVIMYILNAVISLLLGFCLLLPFMNSKINYLTKNNKGTDLCDNPVQVKFLVAAMLAFLYIPASTIVIIDQLIRHPNVFIVIRLVYYVLVLVFGLFGYEVLVCICHCAMKEKGEGQEQNKESKTCTCLSLSVKVLSLALILLSLSVFPTLLLLFAHPENTFALIVIHVALFYTETVIGAYIIERMNRCIRPCCHTSSCCQTGGNHTCVELRELNAEKEDPQRALLGNEDNKESNTRAGKCLLIVGIIFLVAVLVSIYFSLVWLYQFVILRNASSNVAFDMIIRYIPGVAIAALGFFVSKTNKQETMNSKNAKRWLKLGEFLDMSKKDREKDKDLDEKKKNQIKRLREAYNIKDE